MPAGPVPGAPTGTYRVQLTPGHGFASLADAAGYLARLGASHAYLSPVLQAAPGSLHGYDVVDHDHVSYDLGGEPGLRAAAERLRAAGVGVVVDVVPNHMAVPVPEHLNAELWTVLRDGPGADHASWFDVDWGPRGRLVVPVLGRRIDECLDAGELVVERRGGPDGAPVVRYFDHVLPVRPGTEDLPLEDLLAAQHYRLAYWKAADEELNYRRFFDVDTLVGVRVEEPEVFDATHAVLVGLVRDGVVDGLRVDHPDGLADPRGYLRRLEAATGGVWVVVEKILEGDEPLPPDWPCAGTTGYDALARIGGLLLDPAGVAALHAAHAARTGDAGWEAVADRSRRDVLRTGLVAEVDRLAGVAWEACRSEVRLWDYSRRGLTEAAYELLAAFGVYRAYVVPGEPAPAEPVRQVEAAAAAAAARRPDRAAEVGVLADLALGRRGRGAAKDEFCVRFQQTTGPAIAKGVEDTACYRWAPLAGANEVGGRPGDPAVDPAAFHAWAARRQEAWPASMSTLSTHDTKRSEDVRARLALLSEDPGGFVGRVDAWRARVGPLRLPDGTGLPALEWLLWQTLVGAWPVDGDRLVAYALKAAREAKQVTSWTTPDAAAEDALAAWVRAVGADAEVRAGVGGYVQDLHPGFAANVLSQRALHLLAPGVPDVYQGCEVVSLRLVDPDNRVHPDPAALAATLDRALAGPADPAGDLDAAKMRLTALGLRLRRDRPHLVGPRAGYRALAVRGPAADHLVAFARGDGLAVLATRLPLGLAAAGGWGATVVDLPAGRWRDLLAERDVDVPAADPAAGTAAGAAAADLLGGWPAAVLVREEAP